MTEQECIDELMRVRVEIERTPGNTFAASALRVEHQRLVARLDEMAEKARKQNERTRLVRVLDARVEQLWNPCDECGEHVDTWDGWICDECEDTFFTGEDE